MNHTVDELKLFRHLALTGANVIHLVFGVLLAVVAAATPVGWQRWFLAFMVMVYLLTTSPSFRDYRALNLRRRHWARHKQVLAAGLALMMLVAVGLVGVLPDAEMHWGLIAGVLAVLVYRLVRVPRSSSSWSPAPAAGTGVAGKAVAGEAAEGPAGGWLPMTPASQIIRAPQGKTWSSVWLTISVVTILIDVIGGTFAEPDWGRVLAATVMAALFALPLTMKTVGQSLRTWVHFGGNRRRWAGETALAGLSGPASVAVVGVIYIWIAGTARAANTVTILLVSALAAVVLAVLLELADSSGTWVLPGGYLVIVTVLIVLGSAWGMNRLEVISVAVFQYLLFALALPTVVRRHVIFSSGVRSWFGLLTGGERS